MNKLMVSALYVGILPYAPGTFGSLVGILIGLLVQELGGFPLFLISTAFLFFVGWRGCTLYLLMKPDEHDPQEIVIDEIVGQLVSYCPISFYLWVTNSENWNSVFFDWLLAFILFRVFDIKKPWPVSWADKRRSALGVMLDDLLAGFYTAIIIIIMIFTF